MRTKCVALLAILHFRCLHVRILAMDLNPLNHSPESTHLGSIYQANMKKSIKPCVNFYDYVCHNWEKYNPKPLFEPLWNVESAMELRAYEAVKTHIENPTNVFSGPYEQAKALYDICKNSPSLERLDAKKIKKLISKYPKCDMLYPKNQQSLIELPWKIDKIYIQLTGESALFDHKILFDVAKGSGFIIQLYSMASPYGIMRSNWNIHKDKNQTARYMKFLKTIIKQVAPNPHDLSWDLIETDLKRVLLFRERLRQAIASTEKQSIRISVKNFQDYNNFLINSREVPLVDWFQRINAMYKNPNNLLPYNVTMESELIVDRRYFINLLDILKSTVDRVIVNHIHLYFLERHLNFGTEMLKDFEESFDGRTSQTGLFRVDIPKWKKCLIQSNLQVPLGKMYLESSFKDSSTALIKMLLNHMKELLKKEILNSKWLDLSTKNSSISKLECLEKQISQPRLFTGNTSSESRGLQDNPMLAYAEYEPRTNRICNY